MAIRSEKTVNTLFRKVQIFWIPKQVVHMLTTYSEGLWAFCVKYTLFMRRNIFQKIRWNLKRASFKAEV